MSSLNMDNSSASGEAMPKARFVTLRAILLGIIGSLAIGIGVPYGTHIVQGSYMDLDFSTPAAILLLFFLVFFVNAIWKRISPKKAMRANELIVVYVMLIASCAIPVMGLGSQLLPVIAAPFYYNNDTTQFKEKLWEHMNPKLFPIDPTLESPDPAVKGPIQNFFEGAPDAPIPWSAWLPALMYWLPVFIALYTVMICVVVILRKQWMNRERLAYPLAQLPMDMVNEDDPLMKKATFKIGLAIPMVIGTLMALHAYFPTVPTPVLVTDTMVLNTKFIIRLSIPMIGFFFFSNLDTIFSLWFFNLLFFIINAQLNNLGITWSEAAGASCSYGTLISSYKYLGVGAMIALVVGGLYLAKPYLLEIWNNAVRNKPIEESPHEFLSYKTAFWGIVVGLIVMSFWLAFAGVPYWAAWLYIILAFMFFIGLTRVVVESGLAEAVAASIAPAYMTLITGNTLYGNRGITGLALPWVYSADIRTYVLASAAHGAYLSEHNKIEGRKMTVGIVLAIAVTAVASIWFTMHLAYKFGGINMNAWFMTPGAQMPWKWAVDQMKNPVGPSYLGWFFTFLGAFIMFALQSLRMKYIWWPLHPLGFCVGSTWIMNHLWLSAMIAWIIKLIILKTGGLKLYKTSRPFFLGLICGQFVINGIWLIIDGFTGVKGNQIFWI